MLEEKLMQDPSHLLEGHVVTQGTNGKSDMQIDQI